MACLLFGFHGAVGALARPCDGVVTQTLFSWPLEWAEWTHCDGKSALLIHTDGLLWRCWAERQAATAAAAERTRGCSVSQYVDFSLVSLLVAPQTWHSNRWSLQCSLADRTRLFSPKADTHTPLYAERPQGTHAFIPWGEAPRGQNDNLSPI